MKSGPPRSFGAQLKALRETAGFTQEEIATIAGLSVHAVSALERGERRRPHVETVRALSAALDLSGATRDALVQSARAPSQTATIDEPGVVALPLAPTVLLGRAADLDALRNWFADETARLITLVGPGGVGKTSLALQLARVIAEDGALRVVFVTLAAIHNPAFVASAIAEAFGLPDLTAVDLSKGARFACGNHPTLLVLDNFEQVLDAAPLVADLLTSVPLLRVVATSRAPLRIRGEREYAVEPLAMALDVDTMSPADALEGLADYCMSEVSLVAAGLLGSTQAEWLGRARDDLESYRSAMAWLIARQRPADAAGIAWGLMFFWFVRGHAVDGLRWHEQILSQPLLPAEERTAWLK